MNNFIVIVIIILNIFLKYVLGFVNNIIIILVINSTSVHAFLKECKKSQYFGFSAGLADAISPQKWPEMVDMFSCDVTGGGYGLYS